MNPYYALGLSLVRVLLIKNLLMENHHYAPSCSVPIKWSSTAKYWQGTHTLVSKSQPNQKLLKRLAENEDFLFEVHDLLTETVKAKRAITPAGEWLLDNFYLIEEQIRTGKKHLPKGYSRELPRLLKGSSKGLPRVYDIAQEIISHGDGRVDPENLNRFVTAYQTITTLKIR